MDRFALEYDFEVYTIQYELKETQRKVLYYENFEDLLKDYRKKKQAVCMGFISYNKNFKVYEIVPKEMDIATLDKLL